MVQMDKWRWVSRLLNRCSDDLVRVAETLGEAYIQVSRDSFHSNKYILARFKITPFHFLRGCSTYPFGSLHMHTYRYTSFPQVQAETTLFCCDPEISLSLHRHSPISSYILGYSWADLLPKLPKYNNIDGDIWNVSMNVVIKHHSSAPQLQD